MSKYSLMKLLSLVIPVSKKNIYFDSFGGSQYSDSPKAIYEYVKQQYPNYNCYWGVAEKYSDRFQDDNINTVKRGTLKWMVTLLKSKHWVSNSRLPQYVYKPKNVSYIQTWHGTPLKKLVLDIENINIKGTTPEKYINDFLSEANKWDYLISPNSYSTAIFKRCFDFKNEIIEIGYPRNDFLINNNNRKTIEDIKEKLDIPIDKKVILYAPTWRDKHSFKMPLSIYKMKKALGDKYIFLNRWHYLVNNRPNTPGHEDFVKDVTDYPDIKELYLISDVLVTDYSSVFFDFAILKRPMIFYCYDYELYKDELRGFYFDFEENAPGGIAQNTDELIVKILDTENDTNNITEFFETFSSLEKGVSTKLISERFFG